MGPTSQKFFINLVKETKAKIKDGDNQIKIKRAWIAASKKLCNSSEFNVIAPKVNWVGYIDGLTGNDDGSVNVEITFDNYKNEVQHYNYNGPLIDVLLDRTRKFFIAKAFSK